MSTDFETALTGMPVIAILRGVRPAEAASVGDALFRAGIRIIEVPLNSPEPMLSIRNLAKALGDSCVIGAGTVLRADEVDAVVDAGGHLIVSPNTNPGVISRTLTLGAISLPGIGTATEAFLAYESGARYLKLFPASTFGTSHARALLAVLPRDAVLLGVGGIGPHEVGAWISAGVGGVGMGSEIYRPGDSVDAVFDKATAVVHALRHRKEIT